LHVFVEVVIILNAIQLGICTHPEDSKDLELGCLISENVFVFIFFVEIVVKFYLHGIGYFKKGWHMLDLFLVSLAVVDSWIIRGILHIVEARWLRNASFLRLVRLLRILRILKVLSARDELRMVLEGLTAAFRSMFWVATLLGLLIYCTSIFCVSLFRDVDSDSPMVFTTIPRAMFTIFTLTVLADWTDIISPVMDEFWWSPLFFVAFIFISTLGILNLIIGVITQRTAQVQQEYEAAEKLNKETVAMKNIAKVADLIFEDPDLAILPEDDDEEGEGGTISEEGMENGLVHPTHGPIISELMKNVHLPHGFTIATLHKMFDRDSSGTITHREFVEGMGRIIFNSSFQRDVMLQSSIASVLHEMKAMEGRMLQEMHAEFDKLRKDMAVAVGQEHSAVASLSTPVPKEGAGLLIPPPRQHDEQGLIAQLLQPLDRFMEENATWLRSTEVENSDAPSQVGMVSQGDLRIVTAAGQPEPEIQAGERLMPNVVSWREKREGEGDGQQVRYVPPLQRYSKRLRL